MARNLRSNDELIAHAVRHSGLSKARPQDIAFYVAAYRDGQFDWRAIRQRGALLAREEVKALGISYRGRLTHEFIDTLNDKGMEEPADAGHVICFYASALIDSAERLKMARHAGIETIRFRASNMAAGPCPKAKALDEKRIAIGDVELVPFDECTHPGQCACLLQSWLPLMDELGMG